MNVPSAACAACGAANDRLDPRCRSCGAYLHDRVAALNLFSTAWKVLESPARAMLRVAWSEQKNYTALLFAAAGPALTAAATSGSGAYLPFPAQLAVVALAGPVVGVVSWTLLSLLLHRLARFVLPRRPWKLTASLLAYALVPFVAGTWILLPAMLAVFGDTLFGAGPAPWELHAALFWLLAVAAALMAIWHVVLVFFAFRTLGSAATAALAGSGAYVALSAGLVYALARVLEAATPMLITVFPV